MSKELLPDVFKKNLKIIFCGMAAGELSVKVGGYYAKLGNRFWDVLYELKFTEKRIRSCEYRDVLRYNIGLTDLVKNQSGVDRNINPKKSDIKILKQKIYQWKPNILAFNGKNPAQKFLDIRKKRISWGKQTDKIGNTEIWVLPSTSGLNGKWNTNNHEKIWKKLYQKIK